MTRARMMCGVGGCALAALAVSARTSSACGGFFCATVPIDQSGENILFSLQPDGVRAYIQIQYQGKADAFAWVVPVSQPPRKIGVGVQQVFTTLLGQTAPQFRLDWNVSCAYSGAGGAGGSSGGFDAGVASADGAAGVTIVAQGEVGPYDYVVLAATEADKLKSWLDDNGFVQPASAQPALAKYVQDRFAFVAIKLRRDAQVGDIQPLVLDLPSTEACVPLVLTRIAATPDMPVTVMVLGKGRAVPRNWFQVQVNPRRIDWFHSGANYRQVATAAIDEAAGHAFVTEFSDSTARFDRTLWAPGRYDLTRLRTIKDPVQFVNALLAIGLPRDPIIQSLLRKYIPMPASVRARGVPEAAFYNYLEPYAADLRNQPFDPAGFADELDQRIVTPLREAQQMIDAQPTLTRLFTTVSPEEMTRDPLFDLNRDLPPVSNVHVALATGTCGADGRVSNTKLTFSDGDTVAIAGSFYEYAGPATAAYMQGQPAAARIQLVGPAGSPVPIAASAARRFDEQLDRMDPEVVRELARQAAPGLPPPPPPSNDAGAPMAQDGGAPAEPGPQPATTPTGSGHGGCSAAGTGAAAPAPALLVAAALWLTSRRRSTRRRRGAGGCGGGGRTTG